MNLIRSVTQRINPEDNSMSFVVTLNHFNEVVAHNLMNEVIDQVTQAVSKAYVEQHGDEIIKRIQEQTIDAKVIQKVVANLRKELKNENHNA